MLASKVYRDMTHNLAYKMHGPASLGQPDSVGVAEVMDPELRPYSLACLLPAVIWRVPGQLLQRLRIIEYSFPMNRHGCDCAQRRFCQDSYLIYIDFVSRQWGATSKRYGDG